MTPPRKTKLSSTLRKHICRHLFAEMEQSSDKRCEELVMTESDPAQFLRCDNLDKVLAAQRLVRYWKVRLSLFGEDRACLPMALELEGATREDRIMLETSAVVMALEDDGVGRSVLYWDRCPRVG